jgi:uncharacterized protein
MSVGGSGGWGALVGLGLVAGVVGGMFGIGGGLIMVPALVLMFGFDIKTATGTSLLAQLLPVGLLGVLEYWRRGEVQINSAFLIAGGLIVGVLLGSLLAGQLPGASVKRGYGVFLVVVGVYFFLAPPIQPRAKVVEPPVAAQPPAP